MPKHHTRQKWRQKPSSSSSSSLRRRPRPLRSSNGGHSSPYPNPSCAGSPPPVPPAATSPAPRARTIADRLDGGWGFWSGVWSMGWDYLRHYSWQDLLFTWPPQEVFGVMTDINQLLAAVNELGRVGSDAGRARWVADNYRRVFSAGSSLLKRLLLAFSRSVSGWVLGGLRVAGHVFDGIRE